MSADIDSSNTTLPPSSNGGDMPPTDHATTNAKGAANKSASLSLPPRARRSTSAASASALSITKNSFQPLTTTYPPLIINHHHDTHVLESITSSDDESTPRLQLRRAITEYRHSLTLSELSFLKELVSSGNESNVQSALETLKDDTLFSPPSPPESKVVAPIQVVAEGSNTTTKNTTQIPPILSPVSIPKLDDTECNVHHPTTTTNHDTGIKNPSKTQLISGSDGLDLLERYKKSIQEKDIHHHTLQEDLLLLQSAYDLDKPIDLVHKTLSFGSEARGAHIEKRIASTVHGNLWKAHESGISLHSIPRFNIQQQQQQQPMVFHPNTLLDQRPPEPLRRSSSAMSSSTMDLVEFGGPFACRMLDNIFRTYSPPRQVFVERKGIPDIHTTAAILPGNETTNNTATITTATDTVTPPTTTSSSSSPVVGNTIVHLRNHYHRSHSRSESIVSTSSSIGSSHFDWPPSNFETIFRARMNALHQHSRSPSISKKLLQLNGGDVMDTPTRLRYLPPIQHHIRRNSSSARSISSIPSLHRASLIRSHSMACTLFYGIVIFLYGGMEKYLIVLVLNILYSIDCICRSSTGYFRDGRYRN